MKVIQLLEWHGYRSMPSTMKSHLKKSLLLVSLLLVCKPLFAQGISLSNPQACLSQIENDVFQRTLDLDNFYMAQDPESMGVHSGGWANFMPGTNGRAVLIVHGFSASPFEIMPAALALHQQGYSVFPLLVDGFGSSAKVANLRSYKDWQKSIQWAVHTLHQCFSSISVVGFSLGGGLALDLALNGEQNQMKIDHLVLLSPYAKAKIHTPILIADLYELFSFSNRANYHLISGIGTLNGSSHDLKIPIKHSGEDYPEAFPLHAVKEITRFSKKVLIPSLKIKRSQIPTLMVYSEFDHTINWKVTRALLQISFKNINFIAYAQEEKIVHQIDVVDSQNNLQDLHRAIIEFLQAHL